jgi:hypothetical protein
MADTTAPTTTGAPAATPATPGSGSPAEAEVRAAGSDRDRLEQLRHAFQARIARRSDDFDASRGLRAAEEAVRALAPEGADPWDKAVRKLLR